MSDRTSILERYTGRSTDPNTTVATAPDPDELAQVEVNTDAFGWMRGLTARAIMLELRRRDGRVMAVGYGWIERVEYDPAAGIGLHALGKVFLIKGRCLNTPQPGGVALLAGILRHRITWIQEAQESDRLRGGPHGVLIERIEW